MNSYYPLLNVKKILDSRTRNANRDDCLLVGKPSQEQIAIAQSQQKEHAEIWLTVFKCCLMKCYEIDFPVEKYVP